MLTLYKALENQVISSDNNISGAEKAKCAEVAANIAIDVLKMESEGIKAVKQGHVLMAEAAAAAAKTARTLSTSTVSDSDMIEELENRCSWLFFFNNPKDRKSTTFLKEHTINNHKEKTIPERSL